MNINVNKNDKTVVFEVEGRLDTTTAPLLENEIKENSENCEALVLDFKNLEYISSAGLRVILTTQKAMNAKGKMVVKNVNSTVMEVFEITGFSDILTIE